MSLLPQLSLKVLKVLLKKKRVSSVLIVLTGSYSSWVACLKVETFPTPRESGSLAGEWLRLHLPI